MVTHKIIQILLSAPKFPGRDFLIERLPKWFIKPAQGKVILQTLFGFKIELDPNFDKTIENVIYERGVYEQGTVSVLSSFLKQGDTFVDVGANIGFLSLVAANKVGPTGSVHAFEPFPETFNILEKNKNINDYEQLKTYDFALGNSAEILMIYPEIDNRGGASIVNHQSDNGVGIRTKRLDDLDFTSPIDVIKIDVEGVEFEVLKGAEETIKKDRPKLVVEYSIDRNNTIESYEIYDWLLSLGFYRIFRLKNGKERRSKLIEIKSTGDLPIHDNIICIPLSDSD